jgi:excinuclease ABC subunit C
MSQRDIIMEEKLKLLPSKPGVYLMRDEKGEIIYVGKASSLKSRVRSYFSSPEKQGAKVAAMLQHLHDLDYIVTDSEIEALILECNLIKKHRPKYNIRLRDDKHYPYLKVTLSEEYPRLLVVRSMKKDGDRYFGPYTRSGAMNETLKLLRRLFPLRNCSNSTFKNRSRPCLNAHIARCLAPCTGQLSREKYQEMVSEVVLFLEGKQEDLLARLRRKMEQAARNLEFEKAAEYRDQIQAAEQVLDRQKIISSGQENQDVIATAAGPRETLVQVFFVREGKLNGREQFTLVGTENLPVEEVIEAFFKQYYSQAQEIPGEILLSHQVKEHSLLEAWLSQKAGRKVQIKVPKRGEKFRLVKMVAKNARMALEEEELSREKDRLLTKEAVLELQKELNLASPPRRIEGYDISNLQGKNSVGAMVVFEDGLAKPSQYRRFRIKTVEGPDDYASIKEVLRRRFRRYQEEAGGGGEGKFAQLPDLVLIDGGKGQLSAAREVMDQMNLSYIPAFGLAEKEELLFQEGNPAPIILPRDSAALYLVQRVRDEAHRFALTYHRDLREKAMKKSILDEVPGVGPKRKKALLRHFGSVARIREASLEELLEIEGINKKVALAIKEHL